MRAKLTLNIFRDEIEFFYCVVFETILKCFSKICIDEFKFISFLHHFQNIEWNRIVCRDCVFDFDRVDSRFFRHLCEMACVWFWRVFRVQGCRKKTERNWLINTSQKSVEVFFESRIEFLSTNSLIDVFLKIVSDFPINKSIEVDAFLKVVFWDLFFVLCI